MTQMLDNPVNVEETEASATETNVEETQKFPLLDSEKTEQWMVSREGPGSFWVLIWFALYENAACLSADLTDILSVSE